MRPLAAAVLCLSAVAGAAPSDFTGFVAQFPPLTLPFSSQKTTLPTHRLSPDEAMTWVVEPLSALGEPSSWSHPINHLRGLGGPGKDAPARAMLEATSSGFARGTGLRVAARGSLKRSGALLLVVGVELEAGDYRTSDTWLMTWSPEGRFLGALLVAQHAQSNAGTWQLSGSLEDGGAIARTYVQSFVTGLKQMPELLQVESRWPARLLESGRFEEADPSWTGPAGHFIDRTSHEELEIFAGRPPRVFYRGNDRKPGQELAVSSEGPGPSLVAQFAGLPQKYVLSWDERGATITCLNPDGRKQTFTREQ